MTSSSTRYILALGNTSTFLKIYPRNFPINHFQNLSKTQNQRRKLYVSGKPSIFFNFRNINLSKLIIIGTFVQQKLYIFHFFYIHNSLNSKNSLIYFKLKCLFSNLNTDPSIHQKTRSKDTLNKLQQSNSILNIILLK